jgi:uracil-DNA glycosylase family 4
MAEIPSEIPADQIRAELLAALKVVKSHVQNSDKFAAGLEWKKVERLKKKGVFAAGNMEADLNKACSDMADCQRCGLGKIRRHLVFGDGNPRAQVVFVGEAPGADEDAQGLPFVGRAGQLLTNIIKAMGLERKDVYICNILKCRPPQNRNPLPEEIQACEPFLKNQLRIIAPSIICALGSFAAKTLLKTEVPITALRGRFHSYEGIKLMPTYHPAYLLRNPAAKKFVWEDVQKIMRELQN